MAQFSAKKIDTTTINGGQQVVNGSGVTPELLNAPVESALYTEKAIEVLTSNADVSQANAVGTPTVSFVSKTEGGVEYKYLKFANLKGEIGKTGRTGPEGPEGRIGPVGPRGQTGAAAGFGTPTISVETLGEGSDATATVRASGDNTAKVFAFNLGIPKGDTGRGVKTIVSQGNDLIIKYDDGSEERLRGAIQIINALVADSKADFDAALIEENIGKTISYKDNLYLITGRGRTKLVNNGITDYNALSNTPVYIATSEESFNGYLQSYNLNKIISYNGDLYTVVETKNAPIEVGDTLNDLYFNTNLSTAEVDAILDTIDWSNPDEDMGADVGGVLCYIFALNGNLQLVKMDVVMDGTPVKGYVIGDSGQSCYASNVNCAMVYGGSIAGWDESKIAEWKSSKFPMTVDSIKQQDKWAQLISKEPFGDVSVEHKKVGGSDGTKDYNELINKPIINVSTEAELESANSIDNIGKGIAYDDKFYLVSDNRPKQIEVGDVLDGIYFNTNVSPDLTDYMGVKFINFTDGTSIYVRADSSLPRLYDSTRNIYIHVKESFCIGHICYKPGWNSLDQDGFYNLGTKKTVESLNNIDFWSGFIAKSAFGDEKETNLKEFSAGKSISDVFVNGKSVVFGDAARINKASKKEDGIVTTEYQEFSGNKAFLGEIYAEDKLFIGPYRDLCLRQTNNPTSLRLSAPPNSSNSSSVFPFIVGSTERYIKIDPGAQKIIGSYDGTSTDFTGFKKGTKASGTSGSLSISTTGYTAGFYSIFFTIDDVYYNAHLYYGYRNSTIAEDVPEAVSTPTFVYDATTQSLVYYTVELLSGIFRLCKNDFNGNKTVDTTTTLTYRINNAI